METKYYENGIDLPGNHVTGGTNVHILMVFAKRRGGPASQSWTYVGGVLVTPVSDTSVE